MRSHSESVIITTCVSLLDERSSDGLLLIWHFRQIISLTSLAYIFTTIHAIQYSMRDHVDDMDSLNPQGVADSTESHYSASSAIHNLPQTATTSTSNTESSERTSGRWTNNEIALLLEYVRENCVLTTTRGLNLKKNALTRLTTW